MNNTTSVFTSVSFGFRRAGLLAVASLLALGVTGQAQLTNNPYAVNVTNTTALAPIAFGFGVAVLGYGMPTPGTNFLANNLDGIAVSDATSDGNNFQFFVADHDSLGTPPTTPYSQNLVGHRVLQSISNPTSFTVIRSFVASIQTNGAVGPDSGFGSGAAGTFGLGGVSKDGTIAFRMDGSTAPASPGMAGEGVGVVPAQVNSTIIFTNALENCGNILAVDSASGNIPQIGQNQKLIVKSSFGGSPGTFTYVARSDIFSNALGCVVSAAPPTPLCGTNTQIIVGANGSCTLNAVKTFPTWVTRGVVGINDNAKMMAGFCKTAADLATGGDSETGLFVIKYTDAGGPIGITSLQTNIFGKTIAGNFPSGGINTNAQYFFSRNPFVGPAQISINDSGAVAFAVSINIDAANDATNGTRAAQVTGIIYQPAGSTSFLKVVDNTDPTLFWQTPVSCTNKNFISQATLDNYNNVYFLAAYTNNTSFACDLFPSNAIYEAVANDPVNPTSWSTRILMKQGDEFTNSASGDIFRLFDLPYTQSPATRTQSSRSLGADAINRTTFPGHTVTGPSDPFAVGGIIVQATLTNLTRGVRTDALLFIGPFNTTPPPPPFVITSITRSGNDIVLNWSGLAGTNIIQAVSAGSYTNSYSDVGTVVLGSAGPATFTDVGGAATANRWYRIKAMQP
jgi:hypothetical protein